MSQMLIEAQDAPKKVQELLTQDQAVYEELGEKLRNLNPSVVATVARGSSDHAATYAAYLIPLCTGRVVASIPPSLVSILHAPLNLQNQFVLGISQSGASPDIVRTMTSLKESGAFTVSLVNQPNSALAALTHLSLSQRAGQEKSVTATKTVLCTLTAIARLTAAWSKDQTLLASLEALPSLLTKAADVGTLIDNQLLKNVSRAYVLSRGLGFSAATEIALKLKETCAIHAEAFSSAEVRHGPREVVDSSFLVIVLAHPGPGQEDLLRVAEEMRQQGAKVITVSDKSAEFCLPHCNDYRVAPLVALQLLYPWIARCASAMGRNPDQPKTLTSKVIHTI